MELAIKVDFTDRAANLITALINVLSSPAVDIVSLPSRPATLAPTSEAAPQPAQTQPEPAAKDATSQEPAAEDHGITLEALRAELRGLLTDTAKGLIRQFGVEALSKVAKEHYPALLEAARKAKE